MITIDELMTTDPYALRGTDSIHDAWQIMNEKRVRHIPITDDNHHVIGLVTQRDVLAATRPSSLSKAGSDDESDNPDIMLSDIMIKNVTVIHQSENLRQAALHMQSHKHGCLPVVSDDRLVGIITDSDFVSIAINLLEQVELLEEPADDDIDQDVQVSAVTEGE